MIVALLLALTGTAFTGWLRKESDVSVITQSF